MQRLLDFLENLLGRILGFLIDRVPMPAGVRDAIRAKKQTLHEIVKFSIAGLGATVVFYSVYNVLLLLLPDTFSTGLILAIANIPAILTAYVISAKFVFAGHSGHDRRVEVLMFFMLNAAAVAIGYFAVGFVEWMMGVQRLSLLMANIVPAAAIVLSWGLRFVVAKRFIFKAHLERHPVDVATELAHLVEEIEEEESEERQIAEA